MEGHPTRFHPTTPAAISDLQLSFVEEFLTVDTGASRTLTQLRLRSRDRLRL